MNIYSSFIHDAKIGEQPKCPSDVLQRKGVGGAVNMGTLHLQEVPPHDSAVAVRKVKTKQPLLQPENVLLASRFPKLFQWRD